MARVEKTKVVTNFNVSLSPSEYRIIMESLSDYKEKMESELKEIKNDNSYECDTQYEEGYIGEIKTLLHTLENEYKDEWIGE